jgi:hypothetical protein
MRSSSLYVSKDRRLIWLNNRASRLALDDNYTTPYVLKFDRKGVGVVYPLTQAFFTSGATSMAFTSPLDTLPHCVPGNGQWSHCLIHSEVILSRFFGDEIAQILR